MHQPWSVPEVLRPLYESPKILAQKTTIAVSLIGYLSSISLVIYHQSHFHIFQALRHLTQIAQEISGEVPYGGGRQPAVLRAFSQRLSRSLA